MNRKKNIILINILGFPGGIISLLIGLFYSQSLSLAFFFTYFGFFYLFLSKRILAMIPLYPSVKRAWKKGKRFFDSQTKYQDQGYEPLINASVSGKILLVQSIGLFLLVIGLIFFISSI